MDTLIFDRIIQTSQMRFAKKHIQGLFGIILLFFYLVYNNLSKEPFPLVTIERLILLTGISLCVVEFIPERIKISLSNYTLIPVVDKLISKYGSLFLYFLIVIGFYLRFNNLGNVSFSVDEFFTTYAAIGIFEHGTPVMPSGMSYTRSILNTSLIALSFKIFGINEFSARIVSVIFGTLTIPLVYLMGAKLANKRVGLLAAVLITFSVWEIVLAREARMYAQFQFFYLLTAYLFYSGLNKNNLKILSFSAIAFICALLSHRLALSFLPVVVIYILLYKREILKERYFIFGTLISAGLALLYMIVTGKTPFDYIPSSSPIWAQKSLYFYAITTHLSILFLLVCISGVVSIMLWRYAPIKNRNGNPYFYPYLLLNFFIPFIILSISSWKCSRYAFYIFPFLVLSASYVIDLYIIRKVINEDVCTQISNKFKIKKELVKNLTSAFLFIMVVLLLVQVTFQIDAFFISQKDHGNVSGLYHSNWKKGCGFVEERLVEGDKIMTTVSLAPLYYLGQVDYSIRQKEYSGIINNEGQLVSWYTGDTIVLTTYDSFLKVANNGSGWVIADHRIDWYFTDPRVREYIRNNMTFHPDASDDTIEVYSWNRN